MPIESITMFHPRIMAFLLLRGLTPSLNAIMMVRQQLTSMYPNLEPSQITHYMMQGMMMVAQEQAGHLNVEERVPGKDCETCPAVDECHASTTHGDSEPEHDEEHDDERTPREALLGLLRAISSLGAERESTEPSNAELRKQAAGMHNGNN